MAYLACAEAGMSAPGEAVTLTPRADTTPARLTALEWSVVAIARKDRLSSLRSPGRMSIALGVLFGEGHNPRLADPRLEALRRMAVLTWHNGYTVPPHEVRAFLAAGFSADQYELMVDSIGVARRRSDGVLLAA